MQPPQSIEEIKAGLETTEKGGVRQSIRNCLTVFQRDPLLSGAIAYNILTDRKDIIKPIGFHRESTALNDTDMKYLLLYLEETYGLTNEKKIDNAYVHDLLCNLSGRERRPHGTYRKWFGLRDACGGRHRQAEFSGYPLSWIRAELNIPVQFDKSEFLGVKT